MPDMQIVDIITRFADTFNASRARQDGADLGSQVTELLDQNLLIAETIVALGKHLSEK